MWPLLAHNAINIHVGFFSYLKTFLKKVDQWFKKHPEFFSFF